MEDRGITREELSSAKRATDAVALRSEQLRESLIRLRASLPVTPDQSGTAAEKWLDTAASIARQINSLANDIIPQLDHWVFEPREPGTGEPSRLPELLRTKLTEEQERKDTAVATKQEPLDSRESLTEKQTVISDAVRQIEETFPDSKLAEFRSKKPRLSVQTEQVKASALPLLRAWARNDREKVKTAG
jgi:hypothetical protein